MALSRGMTALRAALGAVGGGLEGYTQFKELERKRQMEQEAMRRAEIGTLLSSGQVRLTPIRREAEMTAGMAQPPAPSLPSSIGRAVQAVESAQPPVAAPVRSQVQPSGQITLAGQEFGLMPGLTDEEKINLEIKKYEAQQDAIAARELEKRDRANRGFFAVLQRAKALGPQSENLTYENFKDIDLEPFFKEYAQGRNLEEAMKRTGMVVAGQRAMGSFLPVMQPGSDQPTIAFGTRGGELLPTPFQAPGKESPLSDRAKKIQETTRPLSTDDAAFVRSFMPTPKMDAQGNVVGYDPPQRRLPPSQALISRGADIVGGLTGEAMYMGASPEAQRLSNIINQQADRRALAEQGGRLSDRDVAIKRAEVAIRSGDVKNDPVLYRKLNDVLSWAQTEPAPQAAQPSAPPTPRPTAQSQGISKAQFANQWKAANPKGANESLEAYARRIQSAWMASQGGR